MKEIIWLMPMFILTGCATIISGRHQDVQVISSLQGAKACAEGQCIITPGTITLRRDSNHAVVIEKDGYMSETVILTSGVGAAIAGNILLGGFIGGGVDPATGAAYKLYPETVNVALRQVQVLLAGSPVSTGGRPQNFNPNDETKVESSPPKQ